MTISGYRTSGTSNRPIDKTPESGGENRASAGRYRIGFIPSAIMGGGANSETAPGAGKSHLFSRGPSKKSVAAFTRELAGMLEAGLSLDKSLTVLADLEEKETLKKIIMELQKGIRAGRSMAECLSNFPDVFSDVYVNAVRAGEAGGVLEEVLSRVAKFMEDEEALKEEVVSALIYPALLLAAGAATIIFMLLFVIPGFADIFAGTGSLMPLPTRVLLGASLTFSRYWWVAASVLGLSAILVKKRFKTAEGRLVLDRFKTKAPLIREAAKKAATARFSRTLGTLLQSGLPIMDALRIAINALGNRHMIEQAGKVLEGVRRGRGIAAPLKEAGVLPPLAMHMLTVGEETGRLDEMLVRIADKYDRELSIFIKRALTILEPALILIMAVLVGSMVVSLLLAIFSLNDLPF